MKVYVMKYYAIEHIPTNLAHISRGLGSKMPCQLFHLFRHVTLNKSSESYKQRQKPQTQNE